MNVLITIEIPDLADRLLVAKKQSGLTYKAIADKAEVTDAAVWQVLKGRNQGTNEKTVLAIGDVLGIDFRDEIFEKVEELLDETLNSGS